MTRLLTTIEAAAALGVSPRRVRRLAQDGRLRGATRRGRDWTIPADRDGRPVVLPPPRRSR